MLQTSKMDAARFAHPHTTGRGHGLIGAPGFASALHAEKNTKTKSQHQQNIVSQIQSNVQLINIEAYNELQSKNMYK